MTDQRATAQLTMLASDLGVEPERLASLRRLDATYLHDLRAAVSARLFDAHEPMFRRISKLAPLVPNALVAKLVPALVPPLVSGFAAGAVAADNADRIDDLLPRLPATYMAACAPYLDLRIVARLAPLVPPEAIIPTAKVLLAEEAYAVAAGFVEFATPELVEAFERGIDDDRAILLTGTYVYSDEILSLVVSQLPEARLRRFFTNGLTETETARAALSILARVDEPTLERVIKIVHSAPDDTVTVALQELLREEDLPASLADVARRLLEAT